MICILSTRTILREDDDADGCSDPKETRATLTIMIITVDHCAR